jgi:hypothetical protein
MSGSGFGTSIREKVYITAVTCNNCVWHSRLLFDSRVNRVRRKVR